MHRMHRPHITINPRCAAVCCTSQAGAGQPIVVNTVVPVLFSQQDLLEGFNLKCFKKIAPKSFFSENLTNQKKTVSCEKMKPFKVGTENNSVLRIFNTAKTQLVLDHSVQK